MSTLRAKNKTSSAKVGNPHTAHEKARVEQDPEPPRTESDAAVDAVELYNLPFTD